MTRSFLLRPDADRLDPAGWVPTSGTDLFSRIADGSIASPNDATAIVNLFDFDLAVVRIEDSVDATYLANDVFIEQVRIRVRVKLDAASPASSIRAHVGDGTRADPRDDDFAPPSTSYVQINGQWRTVAPYGGNWRKEDVAGLTVGFRENFSAKTWLSTLDVQVQYSMPPVATVTAPSGAITTSTPDIEWTSSQEDGFQQSHYRVRVFDQITYERGDFDPAHSPPVAQATATAGTAQSWRVNVPLANGTTYKAYVSTAVVRAGTTVWSAWDAGSTFSLAIDAPATPTLTVEPQLQAGRIRIDVQGLDNLLGTQDADLERDTASVGAWEALSAGATLANSATVASHGTRSLRMTAAAAATFQVISRNAWVTPGERLSASAKFRAGTTGRSVRVSIGTWSTAGITGVFDGTAVSDSSGAWTLATVEDVVVPADSVYATMQLSVLSPANGEIHYADEIKLNRGPTAATWTRGGLWPRNLLSTQDADLETAADLGTWVAGTGTTIAQSTTVAQHGTGSLRLTSSGGAGMSAVAGGSGTSAIPIMAGETYTVIGSFRSAVTARFVSLGVLWYGADGALLEADSEYVGGDTTSAWNPFSRTVVAPDDASFAAVIVAVGGSLAVSEIHYVDQISFARGDATTWSPGQGSRVTTFFVVEASDDAGETWAPILNSPLAPDLYEAALVYDNAVAPDAVRLYRARTEAVDVFVSADQALSSPNTDTVAAGCPTRRWWIRSLGRSGNSVGSSSEFGVLRGGVKRKREQRKGKFNGLGAALPTFVTDSTGGEDGTLDLVVYGNDVWAELDAIFQEGDTIYVVDPIQQRGCFAHIDGDVTWDENVVLAGVKRTASISYTEVAGP